MYIRYAVVFLLLISTNSLSQQFPGMDSEVRGHGFSTAYSLLNAVRYNRVEGAFLGGEITLKNEHFRGLELVSMAGYGLKSEAMRSRIRLEYAFDFFRYRTVYLSAYDITGSEDMELVGNVENSLSSLLFHRDYRDYFRLRGFEGGMDLRYKQKYGVTFLLKYGEYGSMPNTTNNSIFYDNREFRENPAVDEGTALTAAFGIYYSNRENIYVEANYWEFNAELEREFRDYKFTGFHVGLRRIQLGFSKQTLIAYGAASFRNDREAEQFLFDLGGTGTVRGYGFKEYSGSNRFLFSTEYQFNGDILQQIPLQKIPFYSSLAMSLFFDAGKVWTPKKHELTPNSTEPRESKDSPFKSSAGASFYLLNKMLRLDLAKRLDRSEDPWKFNLRFIWGLKN